MFPNIGHPRGLIHSGKTMLLDGDDITFAFRVCGQPGSWKISTNLKNAFRFQSTEYVCEHNNFIYTLDSEVKRCSVVFTGTIAIQ